MRASRAARLGTLAPALILFALVALLPIAELLALSVSHVEFRQGVAQWRFVGTAQYVRAFGTAPSEGRRKRRAA